MKTAPPVAHIMLLAVTLLFGFPLLWMVSCSLKSSPELTENPFRLLPEQVAWGNYREALRAMPFQRSLSNTLLLCFGTVCGTLVSCSLTAESSLRFPSCTIDSAAAPDWFA